MRLRILYVEDSPSDRDLLHLQLARADSEFELTDAADLKTALAALKKEHFDVILTDLNLPDSQGIATVKALLGAEHGAPIIAFTGSLDVQHGVEAVAAGAADFVAKGLSDAATLAQRLRFAAGRKATAVSSDKLEALLVQRTEALHLALTQLKQTNEQLAEQKQRLDLFMDAVPSFCFLVAAETGRVVFASKGYEAVYGRPPAAILADPNDWIQSVHPDDRERMRQASEAKGAGNTQNTYRILREGEVKWLRATYTRVNGPDGRLAFVAGTVEDVTQAHQVAELEEANRTKGAALEVEQRNSKFKAQFLNMAAHDLATPITPLVLQVAVLRAKARAAKDEGMLASLGMLERNLTRLTGLIQDVLDVGRIEAGRVTMNLQPVALADVVKDAVGTMDAMANAGKVRLEVAVSDVQPIADAERLAQITLNLLSNAVKYTPHGGRVRIAVRQDGHEAVMDFSDDGRGISAEDLPRLFQPFVRVGDTAAVKGTGLGLYISRGLARALGGTLHASSDGPGKGSTFTLRLPLAGPPTAAAPASAAA